MLHAHDAVEAKQDKFDVFVSYARVDNGTADGSPGWVDCIRDQLVADFQSFGQPLRVFLDTDAVQSMDDWRRRILTALRQSRMLFVCLSPAYFSSPYCRMEHVEYLARQAQLMVGDESIASVYFVTVPAAFENAELDIWKRRLDTAQHVDLRAWYPLGPRALELAEVRDSIRALGAALWERIELSRRGAHIDGNVPSANPYFVGRSEELRSLHDLLVAGREGSVTIVNGVGGMGKTELLVQYAHAFRFAYPGGVWIVGAEGHESLLEAIAPLAADPRVGVLLTDAERNDLEATGRRVAETLRRRGNDQGPTLLILDNVSNPRLFSAVQLASLRPDSHLILVASARLGENDFLSAPRALAYLTIERLYSADAVALIREHQPPRTDGLPGFSSLAEETAATSIVRELDGYTLSVEQIAVYLGLPGSPSVADALVELREFGSWALDEAVGTGVPFELASRHQVRVVRRVLDQTLSALERDDPIARAAVEFAALLPPDAVPWSWLEAHARRSNPGHFSPHPFDSAPWASVRARLVGRRIITPTDNPALGRMHRVFGELIRESQSAAAETVAELIAERLLGLAAGRRIAAWEYRVMQRTLEAIDPATLGWDTAVDRLLGVALMFLSPAELVTLARARYLSARSKLSRFESGENTEDVIRSACAYSAVLSEIDPVAGAAAAERALELARGCNTYVPTWRRSAELVLLAQHHVLAYSTKDPEGRAKAGDLSNEAVELARALHRHSEDRAASLLLATALADHSRVRGGRSGWEVEPTALEILGLLGARRNEAPDRSELRVLEAKAWDRLAHSTGAQSAHSIGGEIRRQRILRGCAILREVLEEEPENQEAANALVWALVNLPVALPASAHTAAVAATDEAVERARALTKAFPDRLSYLDLFAYTLSTSYRLLVDDRLDDAQKRAQELLDVCSRIEKAHPDDANRRTATIQALDALRTTTGEPEKSLRLAQDALARRTHGPLSAENPLWSLRERVFAEATVARCAHRASLRALTESTWSRVVDGLDRLATQTAWKVSDRERLLREEAELEWEAPVELREAYADLGRDGSWEGVARSLSRLAAARPGGLSEAGQRMRQEADAVVEQTAARHEAESAELRSSLAAGTLPRIDGLTCRKPAPRDILTPFDAAVDVARAQVERSPDDEARRSLVRALVARADSPGRNQSDAALDRTEAAIQIGQLRRPSFGERRTARRLSRT